MARIIDNNFSERLAAIAGDVNFACFAGHQQAALNSMIELYNTADKYESKRLLRLDSNHAQSIGLAYMWFAIAFNNGNTDPNDVAAENALLCLAMDHFETGNTFGLPAIFTLFNKYNERLDDAITRVLKSSFYYGPINPQGFYKYHIDGYRFYQTSIMYYCLSNFYDIKADKFSIPSDLPYFLPKTEEIHEFLNDIKVNPYWGNESLTAIGHENLVRIYDSICGFIENL
jgi:hypothetical protein